jgi:hypothetical protein
MQTLDRPGQAEVAAEAEVLRKEPAGMVCGLAAGYWWEKSKFITGLNQGLLVDHLLIHRRENTLLIAKGAIPRTSPGRKLCPNNANRTGSAEFEGLRCKANLLSNGGKEFKFDGMRHDSLNVTSNGARERQKLKTIGEKI